MTGRHQGNAGRVEAAKSIDPTSDFWWLDDDPTDDARYWLRAHRREDRLIQLSADHDPVALAVARSILERAISMGPLRRRSFPGMSGALAGMHADRAGATPAPFYAPLICAPLRLPLNPVDGPVDVKTTGECRVELAIAGWDDRHRAGDGAVRGPLLPFA